MKLDITPNTPYDVGLLPSTDLKLSTASKGGVLRSIDGAAGDTAVTADGWIEDPKYGWYFDEVATSASAEFDSAEKRTGKFTLKVEAVDATGTAIVYNTQGVTLPILAMEAIPLKVSTAYRLNIYVKTNAGVGANGVYADVIQYDSAAVVGTTVTTNKVSASSVGWVLITISFTSDNDAVYARIALHNDVAGAVNAAWFDVNSMTLEEVVTDTTFAGKVAEKIRPVLQAVTSTDSIDQSLDTGGAYANTYTLTAAVNEGATHIQTFTPTKKYVTEIGVWVVEAGTGVDWNLIVHTAGNVLLAHRKIAAASLVEGAFNYFIVPNIWISGALHFHLYASATTGTPTCKANGADDLETASYIQRYAKKTESFTVICNGIKTELKSDKDGVLSESIIDLDNGKYIWDLGVIASAVALHTKYANSAYSASVGGGAVTGYGIGLNGWMFDGNEFYGSQAGVERSIVWKVNTLLPIKDKVTFYSKTFEGLNQYIQLQISTDNVNWTTLYTADHTLPNYTNVSKVLVTELLSGLTTFYVRYYRAAAETHYTDFSRLGIEANIDTSKIPAGLFYPLSTNQFTENVILPAVATRVYFRSAKFTNEYGVVVPALEFTDTTPTTIGYVPLKLDNSQETNPCVRILSTTTNYQVSGTGSDSGGYILNDGEYMTLTSTEDNIKVDYQIGGGTTTFANITKNTLFLSSDGYGVDSTQDPSHQMTVDVGVRNQGLLGRVGDLGEEVARVRDEVVKSTPWQEWIPTLTWTTGTPEGSVVTKARYKIVDGVCYFNFYYSATDGNAATALTISLPVPPKDNDSFITLEAQEKSDTTWSNPLAYIDDGATTIAFRSLTTIADTKAVIVMVAGSYEI